MTILVGLLRLWVLLHTLCLLATWLMSAAWFRLVSCKCSCSSGVGCPHGKVFIIGGEGIGKGREERRPTRWARGSNTLLVSLFYWPGYMASQLVTRGSSTCML